MLPYERLWERILNIHTFEVPFGMGKRVGNVSFEDVISAIEEYNINTLEYAYALSEIMEGYGRAVDFSFRYKEPKSILRNWNKDDGTRQLYKVLNDILGLRFVLQITKEDLNLIADGFIESCPLKNIARHLEYHKDGYQGIHIYIRKNTNVLPIEVQLWTRRDALLNRYLRDTIYTQMNDEQLIQYARQLRDWLEEIPILDRDYGIQSYIDYIYEKAFD